MMPRPGRPLLARPLALALALAGAGLSCAARQDTAPTPPERALELGQQGYMKQFDNGLVLFVVPDAHTRLVEFDVRHLVGSRDDPPGKRGLAHLAEHLMFQLPAPGDGAATIMADLPRHALSFDAVTSLDDTHFMHLGTREVIERAMAYTATRLGEGCDAITDDEFAREREVVRNETRWREQSPLARLTAATHAAVYPEGHPYHGAANRADAELITITREDACAFIREHYNPATTRVVITGDVDPNEVVALAKTHLAPLPARAIATRREVPAAIASTTPTRVAAPVSAPAALVLFPMPARFHADRVAAEAAFERLVAFALVSSAMRGSASVVDRMVPAQIGGKQAELVGVAVTTESTAQLAAAVDEVFDGIDIGFDRNLDATELSHSYDIVRQRARLQVVANLATITTRATAIADYLDQGDDAGFFGAELAAIDALTPSQAQLVGRTYFDRARATVIEVVPELRGGTEATAPTLLGQRPPLAEEFALPDDVDAAEAHTPLPVAELAPPEVESLELTLDDGLRVVLVHSTDVPVLQLQLIVGAGQLDTDGRPELAELVAHSFEGGGDTLAGERLGKFALAGGEYAPSVRARATSFSARGLSIYLDFLVAGLAEHVVHAEYQEGSMERWRRAQRKALRQGDAEQDALRHNRYFTALYGEGHPHVHARIATRSDLREVGKRDLEAFRHQHYRAGNSVLIVTGGFDLALAAAHIEAAFGARSRRPQHTRWLAPAEPNTRPRAPEPRPGDVRVITEIDRGRTQTDVRLAFPLAEVYGEDHAALLVAAQMIDARVAAVREHLGASYGVYARIEFEQPRLEIGGALDSSRAAEALAAMLGAVHERPQGDAFDRLFAHARRKVLRDLIAAQGDPTVLSATLAEAARVGRGYAYFGQLNTAVAELTPERVRALLERVVQRQRSVLQLRGPAAGIRDALGVVGEAKTVALPDTATR